MHGPMMVKLLLRHTKLEKSPLRPRKTFENYNPLLNHQTSARLKNLLLFSNLFHIRFLNYEITFSVGLLEYSSSVYIHFLVSKAKEGNSLCKIVVAYADHMYFIFDTND